MEVRPIDVNFSEWDCTLEAIMGQESAPSPGTPGEGWGEGSVGRRSSFEEENRSAKPSPYPLAGSRQFRSLLPEYRETGISDKRSWGTGGPVLRLGMRQIKGMRQDDANRIVTARQIHGPFTSIAQCHRLAGLNTGTIRRLAEADALASIGPTRRPATWEAMTLANVPTPLFDGISSDHTATQLPIMRLGEEVLADYATTGLSLKRHPVSFARAALNQWNVVPCEKLLNEQAFPHGRHVRVAGLVLVRQRPGTASGVVFVTLEDETGIANLILWANVYERYHRAVRRATLLQVDGIVQREGQVIHILAQRFFDRTSLLQGLHQPSRDFH